MFSIEAYTEKLVRLLKEEFRERLLYVGLQGSYLRGEATENSDIDFVVVLEELGIAEMDAYCKILDEAGERERSCGFICGRKELAAWNPLEAGQVLRETKDIYGSRAVLMPAHTRQDEINYLKLSLNNLYHALCHRYIHGGWEKCASKLPGDYKNAFFILQHMHFLESGEFCENKAELTAALEGADQEIMITERMMREGREYDARKAYEQIFDWCKNAILRSDRL